MFGGLLRWWLWGWGAAPAAESTPGRAVCLTGRDRSVTTLTGRDRSVTTLTADLDC
jgi:hypothetical protein